MLCSCSSWSTRSEVLESEVLATLMFNAAIHNYQLGYGAAVAVVLLAISLAFIVTYVIQVMRTEEES